MRKHNYNLQIVKCPFYPYTHPNPKLPTQDYIMSGLSILRLQLKSLFIMVNWVNPFAQAPCTCQVLLQTLQTNISLRGLHLFAWILWTVTGMNLAVFWENLCLPSLCCLHTADIYCLPFSLTATSTLKSLYSPGNTPDPSWHNNIIPKKTKCLPAHHSPRFPVHFFIMGTIAKPKTASPF